MAEDRLKIWETLLQRAFVLIDSTSASGKALTDWSFGGGTVLMLRHRHRLSKDIDIFIPDPQYIGYLTPRLNDEAEALTSDYVEDERSLKLRFPEGEIDFIASAPLTEKPTMLQALLFSPASRRRMRISVKRLLLWKCSTTGAAMTSV